jgi:enoyl-CoA hydratase/carnithine racemase
MSLLAIADEGRVRRITLNRPEKRNALSAALCRDLAAAIEAADHDAAIGAVLLAANGPAFCAGMDLGEIRPGLEEEINDAHEHLFTIGARIAIPIVAAVQGPALGGGTGLVANCHIVIASESASFGLTEIRLGLWPFLVYGAVERALGERRTVELALTGRVFEAAEAWELGLIHEVTDDAETRAGAVAQMVAQSSSTAIRTGLGFVQQVRGKTWRESAQIARRVRNEVFNSPEFVQSIQRFRSKPSTTSRPSDPKNPI